MNILNQADILSSIFAGLIIAAAFPLGALFAIYIKYPTRAEADIAAFGAGIFFAAISFSLVNESVREGNVLTMVIGFVIGAVVFSILNHYLEKITAKQINPSDYENNNSERIERKNNEYQEKGESTGTSAKIVVAGLLLDSIPEALFVGIIIALSHGAIVGAVSALFLGNLATTMEGAKRMTEAGMSVKKIMIRWSFVLLVVAISAPLGFFLVNPLTNAEISILLGFAAGILIAFITEELIPEAYNKANFHIGLSTTFGFLSGYVLFHFL
ncbi:MAG TPA: hypothetical protein VE130_14755 [Nitrososphaeraceae archaeon]|nr:hypothetical protein [Nitrososphaeraceae archaeon]